METLVALLTDHCNITESPIVMFDLLTVKLLMAGGFGTG
jgi:hypothetical protein